GKKNSTEQTRWRPPSTSRPAPAPVSDPPAFTMPGIFLGREDSSRRRDRRAFDAGLRPGPLPDRAASLLPGLLAATRTGPTPAGNDELMLGSGHPINPLRIAGHTSLFPQSATPMAARSVRLGSASRGRSTNSIT